MSLQEDRYLAADKLTQEMVLIPFGNESRISRIVCESYLWAQGCLIKRVGNSKTMAEASTGSDSSTEAGGKWKSITGI